MLLQSSNSGGDIAQAGTSPRQLQPSLLRGSPTATPLQQYRGSSNKHPRHAAGISLSSDTLFGLSVHLTTFWTVHSLSLHYFFLAPSSFLLWNTKGDKIMHGNPGILSTQFLILNSCSLKLCLSFLVLQTPYLVSRTANSVPRFSHCKLRTSFLALQTSSPSPTNYLHIICSSPFTSVY